MFCTNCGEKYEPGQQVCLKCGKLLEEPKSQASVEEDKNSISLNVVAFLIPIVGLILWITMNKKTPIKAKNIGISALVGWAFWFIIQFM